MKSIYAFMHYWFECVILHTLHHKFKTESVIVAAKLRRSHLVNVSYLIPTPMTWKIIGRSSGPYPLLRQGLYDIVLLMRCRVHWASKSLHLRTSGLAFLDVPPMQVIIFPRSHPIQTQVFRHIQSWLEFRTVRVFILVLLEKLLFRVFRIFRENLDHQNESG